MKKLIALAVLAFPLAAHAQTQDVLQGPVINGTHTDTLTNSAQQVNRGGNATATGGNAVARGGQANVVNNVAGGGPYGPAGYPSTIRNTPSSTLALATAYCQNNAGVSGSGPGFSFGLAVGRHDIDCKRLNYALLLEAMGQREAALLVIANNEEVNAALHETARRDQMRIAAQAAAMPPAPARRVVSSGPGPSRSDCAALRRIDRRWTEVQRDYYRDNCG